jgi:ribosomal subunit interface protein
MVRVQITARHCEIPADVLERTEEQVASLSKYSPRATAADVVYFEEKVDKVVEIIVHIDGSEPVIARGQDKEYRTALDQMIDRASRILRKQRDRLTEHQGPPLWERTGNE